VTAKQHKEELQGWKKHNQRTADNSAMQVHIAIWSVLIDILEVLQSERIESDVEVKQTKRGQGRKGSGKASA